MSFSSKFNMIVPAIFCVAMLLAACPAGVPGNTDTGNPDITEGGEQKTQTFRKAGKESPWYDLMPPMPRMTVRVW